MDPPGPHYDSANLYERPRTNSGDLPAFLHDYPHDEDAMDEDVFQGGAVAGEQPDKKGTQRICDMINKIAIRGQAVLFDPAAETFTVLDGELFEQEFMELKASQRKKPEAADRLFAQMYRTYQIFRGTKWASTGTVFAPKNKTVPLPTPGLIQGQRDFISPVLNSHAPSHLDAVVSVASRDPSADGATPSTPQDFISADSVMVNVTNDSGQREQCSLQYFLDVTGAGRIYDTAQKKRKREDGGIGAAGAAGEETAGLPADCMLGAEERLHQPMLSSDVGPVLSSVWNATSKGDQAYFFKRRDGVEPFANGSLVGLIKGQLVGSGEVLGAGEGMLMVVSDLNAKWKGEPIPMTEAEENRGHWCCFLGQVPVTVVGAVKTGEHIGASGSHAGFGEVSAGGKGPIIGIALEDKNDTDPGVVKTLCFAGLNALAAANRSPTEELLTKAIRLEERVDALQVQADQTENIAKAARRRVSSLDRVVNGLIHSRRQQLRVGLMLLLLIAGALLAAFLIVLKDDKELETSDSVRQKPDAIPCVWDGVRCADQNITEPTEEAGYLTCCPPPCFTERCPEPPTPCYAWEDFAGVCPILKCVSAMDFCQGPGNTWSFGGGPPGSGNSDGADPPSDPPPER